MGVRTQAACLYHQIDRLRRDGLFNPRLYGSIHAALLAALAVPVSTRYNALYGAGHFHRCMLKASLLHRFVESTSGVLRAYAQSRTPTARTPAGRWFRRVILRMDAGTLDDSFARSVRGSLATLVTGPLARRGITVAIDKHLIPRYDKKEPGALVRSKLKKSTTRFEAYITAQCVDRKARIQLAAIPVGRGDENAVLVRKIVEQVASYGVRIRLVMLDREFFSADVIAELGRLGVGYLIPCRSTPYVVGAIEQYVSNARPAVSDAVITRGHGSTVSYTMSITGRKKIRRSGEHLPDAVEKHIAFATNIPGINPNKYSMRWGIETGYSNLESIRVRTTSTNPGIRLFNFLYAMMAYNAWIVARAVVSDGKGGGAAPMRLVEFMVLNDIHGACLRPPWPPPD